MMRTIDRLQMKAAPERVFQLATEVEQWPRLLGHYRWVRMLERRDDGGLVEMAAWRPFGWLKYPTWWVSEMRIDPESKVVHYRHVRGITTGMEVAWELQPVEGGTSVSIIHDWIGPGWPLVGRPAASWVIGPVFVHGIAARTLAGIARHAEGGEEAGQRGSGAAGQRRSGTDAKESS